MFKTKVEPSRFSVNCMHINGLNIEGKPIGFTHEEGRVISYDPLVKKATIATSGMGNVVEVRVTFPGRYSEYVTVHGSNVFVPYSKGGGQQRTSDPEEILAFFPYPIKDEPKPTKPTSIPMQAKFRIDHPKY